MTDRSSRKPDLRRAYSIARKPLAVLAVLHDSDERLASMATADLRDWIEGITLALRHERAKGAAGHWSYDLNRHIALKSAFDRVGAEFAKRHAQRPQRKKPRSKPRLHIGKRPASP